MTEYAGNVAKGCFIISAAAFVAGGFFLLKDYFNNKSITTVAEDIVDTASDAVEVVDEVDA